MRGNEGKGNVSLEKRKSKNETAAFSSLFLLSKRLSASLEEEEEAIEGHHSLLRYELQYQSTQHLSLFTLLFTLFFTLLLFRQAAKRD